MALHRVAVYGMETRILKTESKPNILEGAEDVPTPRQTTEVEALIGEYLFDFPELLTPKRIQDFMGKFHGNITKVVVDRE